MKFVELASSTSSGDNKISRSIFQRFKMFQNSLIGILITCYLSGLSQKKKGKQAAYEVSVTKGKESSIQQIHFCDLLEPDSKLFLLFLSSIAATSQITDGNAGTARNSLVRHMSDPLLDMPCFPHQEKGNVPPLIFQMEKRNYYLPVSHQTCSERSLRVILNNSLSCLCYFVYGIQQNSFLCVCVL